MSLKILVTGAGGQLGKTIEELYSENKFDMVFTFVTKKELDITNAQNLQTFFKNKTFNYCINCAAYTNVEQAEKIPEIAYEINAAGVKNLAEVCSKNKIILIHVSTDYVFDGAKRNPYTIEDVPNPINEYGKSKLLGEINIKKILKQFFIVRTSWLYSKKHGDNFYKTIKTLAETKDELSITSEQIGCPTNTENLAKYIIGLIVGKSENYGIKHFSDDIPMTWYDFAVHILSENNLNHKTNLVKTDKYITFAKRPKYTVLEKNK